MTAVPYLEWAWHQWLLTFLSSHRDCFYCNPYLFMFLEMLKEFYLDENFHVFWLAPFSVLAIATWCMVIHSHHNFLSLLLPTAFLDLAILHTWKFLSEVQGCQGIQRFSSNHRLPDFETEIVGVHWKKAVKVICVHTQATVISIIEKILDIQGKFHKIVSILCCIDWPFWRQNQPLWWRPLHVPLVFAWR